MGRIDAVDLMCRFWNTSKPILVEKSPTHAMRMPFLQAMFHPERTFFLVVLRHPFATMRDRYQLDNGVKFLDCGDYQLRHWLLIQHTMIGDLAALKTKVVVHYEQFALYNSSQGAAFLPFSWIDDFRDHECDP